MSATPTVTTTAAVELSPRLQAKLRQVLASYAALHAEQARIKAEMSASREHIEELFADAGEYNALLAGVKVETPEGTVPLKVVTGTTSTLDKVGLMKRFKISPAQWESFVTQTPKKAYLSIRLPGSKTKDDE